MEISVDIQDKRFMDIFKDQKKIIAVYLFGSQVSGKTDKFSDFDFAILFDENQKDRQNIINSLLDKAFSVFGQDRVDIIDISNQPLWFQQVVVKSGKVIYETSRNERLNYERELMENCLKEGVQEYLEDDKMRKQDVQINLETIEENLKRLEEMRKLNYQEFISDYRNFPATLYWLQTSIEALADISRYIIRSLSLPQADEYSQIPMILSDAGYISQKDAEIYVEMVRFRNLIVHHYHKASVEEVYKILIKNLSDIRRWRDRLLEIIDD